MKSHLCTPEECSDTSFVCLQCYFLLVTPRDKEERYILHTTKLRKDTGVGHILRINYRPEHVTERKIQSGTEVTGDEKEDVSSY
jgi:hypothetical protein